MHHPLLLVTAALVILLGASLPEKGPLPEEKPDTRTDTASPAAPTLPEGTEAPKPHTKDAPATLPTVSEDGEKSSPSTKPDDTAVDAPSESAEPPASAIVKEDREKLAACLSDLKSVGAIFSETDPISEEEGVCGIEKPLIVRKPLPGVTLSEPTPMRCEAARALSHWLKDTVQPALAVAVPNAKLTGVRNATTYACRKRNHADAGKISEHARGNAIDIIALELDQGEPVKMTPKAEDSTMIGAFQRTVTAGACLHFTTVLSPGSDATHEDHLHLDVLERNGGYRYCR
ncbi:extensin family protein [Rhizobium helianthi]|uniref:Extensin family protein n=1 Tax=Rhizobium helianthi TaxID=1132695 RepID=A0ABW4M4G3_9HYPH